MNKPYKKNGYGVAEFLILVNVGFMLSTQYGSNTNGFSSQLIPRGKAKTNSMPRREIGTEPACGVKATNAQIDNKPMFCVSLRT